MAHRGLRGAKRNASAADVRAEGVPKRVDVDGAAALVGLEDDFLAAELLDARDAREGKIAVEDPDQTLEIVSIFVVGGSRAGIGISRSRASACASASFSSSHARSSDARSLRSGISVPQRFPEKRDSVVRMPQPSTPSYMTPITSS